MKYFLAITFLIINVFGQSIKTNKIDNSRINRFVEQTREKLELETGLSVVAVIGDSVVYKNGFGYIDIDNEMKATTESPFYLASATKSFVALLNKILMNEGLLDLDEPISTYLSEFKFETKPLNAESISIRDLLSHKHGILSIPATVRTAFTGDHDFEKLKQLYQKPKYVGIKFRYSNDGYVLNSLIIKDYLKRDWNDLITEKIFIPLKMENTSTKASFFSAHQLPKAYSTNNGKVTELKFLKKDNTMHAAGGIISTADDLGNWLKFNLGDGKFNHVQIIPEKDLEEIHSPQVNCDLSFWKYNRYAYGLGWYIAEYQDEVLVHHFGGYSGARSHISFMPKHNIGIAALTNDEGDGYYLVDLIADYIYNLYLGKDADSIANEELQILIEKKNKEQKKDSEQNHTVESSYDTHNLIGKYTNDDFGKIIISNQDKLMLEFGNLTGELIPSSDEMFSVDLTAFKFKVEFIKENNKITALNLHGPTTIHFVKN